ncbi:putative Polycomb group protein ASXL2 isoform X1 [Paramormyrops kingsleyae]|uniref:putative Polycomb group protein ASXL2 isoform X1 n=1 Tax=Paramormyrops kingsleyae TaxID=1676925 RepID=UPI003B96A298
MREKRRRKKGRTWAEAARTVLEKYPNTPMSHKEILQVIQREGLKEISGTSPLACLNAMLHTNSRGEEGIFYKVPGRMGVYTLKKDISDGTKDLLEEASEETSDSNAASDSQSPENGSNPKESGKGKWKRRVPSKLQSQPSSPQTRCSSPSAPSGASKLLSSSQKHSKKALKQALKQQQQKNQRRQGGITPISNPRIIFKSVKDMACPIAAKTAWEVKQLARRSSSPHNSSSSSPSSSSSSSVKMDPCPSARTRKMSQRSDRLSARQLKSGKCAEIDVETPDSILVNTNLRALINKHTLSLLPPEGQQRLLVLLPEVDRQASSDGSLKLSSSALNNEFFTSAAQSWKERLAEGEFTPEMRLRIRQEIDKEKKVEAWKEHFFESYYGQNSGLTIEQSRKLMEAVPGGDSNQSQPTQLPAPEEATAGDNTKTEPETSSDITTASGSEVASEVPATTHEVQEPAGPQTKASPVASQNTQVVPAAVKMDSTENTALAAEKEPKDDGGSKIQLSPRTPPETSPIEKASSELTGIDFKEVNQEPLKRKASSDGETALSPEKRPRVLEAAPLPTSPKPSPESPRVPPLKIPVSRIVPTQAAAGQLSPRSPFATSAASPFRAGARTLADIKAKAQLRRAQSAAAAAAAAVAAAVSSSGGAVPGPGPGGGAGEASPAPRGGALSSQSEPQIKGSSLAGGESQIQLHHAVPPITGQSVLPIKSNTNQSHITLPTASALSKDLPKHPEDRPKELSHSQLSTNSTLDNQVLMTFQAVQKPLLSSVSLISSGTESAPPHSIPIHITASRYVTLEHAFTGGSSGKASSSITSNNPLVTQLLQGKEVPLETILPKPLAEAPPVIGASDDKGQLPSAAFGSLAVGSGGQLVAGVDKQRLFISSHPSVTGASSKEFSLHQREMLNKATQEQILQTLIKRAHTQQFGSGPQSSLQEACALGFPLECPTTASFTAGFSGRKRTSRPAMSGHYLLNISTYGRGSEGSKRAVSAMSSTLVNLKKEYVETEGIPGADNASTREQSAGADSGVKIEPQGPSTDPHSEDLEDTLDFHMQKKIKSEFSSGHSPDKEEKSTQTTGSFAASRAKEIEHVTQVLTGHAALGNNSQSNSISVAPEPYQLQLHTAANPQQTSAYVVQKAHENQGPGNSAGAGSPPGYSPASSSEGSVMSFSVTVTTIPANHSSHGEAAPIPAFTEGAGIDNPPSNCYCRLKAMIMCKGCGAFCHDDCIGPSKLCVSCLVVR